MRNARRWDGDGYDGAAADDGGYCPGFGTDCGDGSRLCGGLGDGFGLRFSEGRRIRFGLGFSEIGYRNRNAGRVGCDGFRGQ